MNLCITGSFGNRDVGDDAMLTCWLQHLAAIGVCRECLWLVGHQPDYMAWYFDHSPARCVRSASFPKGFSVDDMDALLVTGGGTINTRDAHGGSIRRVHQLIAPFFRAGKPVFISGQTVGPLGINEQHDALARDIIGGAEVFTVRDSSWSAQYISDIAAHPQEFACTTDDASHLPCDGALPESIAAFLAADDSPVVAFTLDTYTWATAQKARTVGSVLLHLLNAGWRVVFVPHHPVDTQAIIQYIVPTIPKSQRSRVAVYLTNKARAEACKAIIGRCQLAIGGRYHFAVFAASCETPLVAMAGSKYAFIKHDGLLSALGLGQCVVPPDKLFVPGHLGEVAKEVIADQPTARLPKSVSFDMFTRWYERQAGEAG